MFHVPSWRYALTVYHAGFAVFALVILVQYFRKRRSFFLAARFPKLGILQLTSCFVPWVYAQLVVSFVDPEKSPCVWAYNGFLNGFCADAAILLQSLRVWGLFRRVFLGKHLAETRARLRAQLRRGSFLDSGSPMPKLPSLSLLARLLLRFPQKWQVRLIKYAIPCVFSSLFVIFFLALLAGTVTQTCPEILVSPSSVGNLRLLVVAILVIFTISIAWSIRKFRDNFNIYLEIWRGFALNVVSFTIYLIVFGVIAAGSGSAGAEVLLAQIVVIIFQAQIVITGFYPLKDQRNLERKIVAGDFADVEQLDEVLDGDAAGLMAFEQFMRLEFCEELLEFYHAVAEYRRLHAVSTRPQQKDLARIIFAQFISSSAPSQINLPDALYQRICSTLFGSFSRTGLATSPDRVVSAPIDVYDDAQIEMHRLMKTGPFIRYKHNRRVHHNGQHRLSTTATARPNPHLMVVSTASAPEVVCIEEDSNADDHDETPKEI